MTAEPEPVPRPQRRSEYAIVLISARARKGWVDCLAVARSAMVDAWDRLVREPRTADQRQYQLKGDYATGVYDGVRYDRWQYKISDGGRIWYFVEDSPTRHLAGRVLIERAEPGHPKETERVRGRRR